MKRGGPGTPFVLIVNSYNTGTAVAVLDSKWWSNLITSISALAVRHSCSGRRALPVQSVSAVRARSLAAGGPPTCAQMNKPRTTPTTSTPLLITVRSVCVGVRSFHPGQRRSARATAASGYAGGRQEDYACGRSRQPKRAGGADRRGRGGHLCEGTGVGAAGTDTP